MHYNIVKIVKKFLSLLPHVERIYLFGSVLDSNIVPNDIDVLIIYADYIDSIQGEIKEFSERLEVETNLPVDITILSHEEEKEVCFLTRIKSLQLK